MDKFLWVFIGGGLGSVLRFSISHFFVPTAPHGFPWSTFYANILATILLGFVLGLGWTQLQNERSYLFVAVGLCGGFSTFSTFSKEVAQLLEQQQIGLALSYAAASLVICILVFWGAYWAAGQWRG